MLDRMKAKLTHHSENNPEQTSLSSHPHHTLNPAHLFPLPVQHGFTTFPQCTAHDPHISVLPLSDKALGVEKATPGTTHRVMEVDGVHAWEALYPEGSINPQGKIKGGFGFYLAGPGGACVYEDARDALFSYALRFDDGFEFVKGGKIPGLCECELLRCTRSKSIDAACRKMEVPRRSSRMDVRADDKTAETNASVFD